MQKIAAILGMLVLAATIIIGCDKSGAGDVPADNFDRKALLTNVADNIILPAYTHYGEKVAAMKGAADAFVAAPDQASLATLRAAWRAAYFAWQQVELFNFGPADAALLRNYTNIYPTDVALLHSHISSGNYNLQEVGNNKVQGFPALDFLLYGAGNTDADILGKYTSHADAAKWKKYLLDVVNIISSKTAEVVTAWNGSYRNTFVSNDATGAGSPLSLMVNEYIMNFERFLRSGKFAIPAGVMSGVPAPEKVEAFYAKDLDMALAKTALQASRDFYLGKAFAGSSMGPSLYSYLQALGTNNANTDALATNINTQFGVLQAKMDALGSSVYNAIITNRTAVLDLYDEFQQQVRYLKVDMTSALGITITYTDNDGD